MATSRIADSVGRVLGDRYRLIRPLGVGASAHVYVAEDVKLRRRVAIKVLHPALAGDEAFLRRFRAEAQVVASLRHPNILTVFDWGEDGGSPYLVMELLEGGSLRALLDRGVLLSPAQAAAVGGDAARALDYAHRRGLVHRDIKPANLIFDDEGRVRVADFGLARALAEATWTEPSGAVVGTARYAAPEQVRGATLDSRADVYSLAVMLVEATTGVVPFAADTTLGTLMARLEHPLTVPASAGPLRPVLEAAGTIDPADRLDAAALVKGLDRVASKFPPPARLPLASPMHTGTVEADRASPTEYPGKPRLFDGDAAEVEEDPAGADGFRALRLPAGTALDLREGAEAPLDGARTPVGDSRWPAGDIQWPAGEGVGAGDRDGGDDVPPPAAGPGRRRRVRLVVAVIAGLALLGGGGAAYALESDAFVPSHLVPDVVGKTYAQAEALLQPLHFKLAESGAPQYSSKYQKGLILQETPASGKLKEHKTVRVVLSNGPAPVAVPSLKGQSKSYADGALRSIGLVPNFTNATSLTVGSGLVISSSPASGASLLPGQKVTVVISSGKPMAKVPSLAGTPAGASFATAQAALQALGLKASETPQGDQYSTTVKKGQVIATTPTAGTSEVVGTTIVVEISKGPHYVTIPSVRGDSVAGAAQALTNAGFQPEFNGNPLGTVTGTYPAAGSEAIFGSSISILTG